MTSQIPQSGEEKDQNVVPFTMVEEYSRPSKRTRTDDGKMEVLVPTDQVIAHAGRPGLVTHIMVPPASTGSLNTAGQFSFFIEEDAMKLLRHGLLRFQVTANGGAGARCILAQTPFWFDRIEFIDRQTQYEISRVYGDTLMWWIASLPAYILDHWADKVQFDPDTYRVGWNVHEQGTTRYYWLPLPYMFWDELKLDFTKLTGDLEIKFYTKNGVIARDSVEGKGAVGTVSLNETALLTDTELMDIATTVHYNKMTASFAIRANYADVQRYRITGQVINASTRVTFVLDAFHHRSAFLMLCIRSEANAINENLGVHYERYCSMDGGTLDHLTTSGQSIYGHGRAVECERLRKVVGAEFWHSNQFVDYNNVYIMPFNRETIKGVTGKIDGYWEFKGDRELLEFVPPAAPVTEIQGFTAGGAAIAATEYFTIKFRGHILGPFLGNTPLATLSAAMTTWTPIRKYGWIVFVAGTVSLTGGGVGANATSFQITTSDVTGVDLQGDLFTIEGVGVNTALHTGYTTSRIQVGRPGGWVNGTYQVDIYSIYTREVTFGKGQLRMKDT